jgi:hypothetical protein
MAAKRHRVRLSIIQIEVASRITTMLQKKCARLLSLVPVLIGFLLPSMLAGILRTLRTSHGNGFVTMKTLSFLMLSLCVALPAKCQTASCSLQPPEVMIGEPVTVTVIIHDFNPRHILSYQWTGTGGALMGKDATASVDTNNMAPGSYGITAQVTDPKAKHHNEASCSASYTVRAAPKNPPVLTCTANPSVAMPGLSVTIACNCASPDGIRASVERWTATSGVISGSGNFVSLDTSGAPPGAITVVATCADARGLSTQAATAVTVELPPPPPQATKMIQCGFSSEAQPWRVDNTCKAMLDDVALRLIQEPDARLVIVGNASPTEKRPNLAAERAVDCKFYLTQGETRQRIDASRIETRTGSVGTPTAEFWIVPPGATFEVPGTTPVDESKVRPVMNHPVGKRKPQQP